jgi:ComF family protein
VNQATWLVDFFFPPRCPACRERTATVELCHHCQAAVRAAGTPLCTRCGLPRHGSGGDHPCGRCVRRSPHFARARACASYRHDESSPVIEVLQRLKYGRDITYGGVLGRYLCSHLPMVIDHDVIVPVPLHLHRLRWRGFNQSALLARVLAAHTGRRIELQALARLRATPPQVGLGERARRRNVARAFSVRDPERLRDRRVLLIDDVMTTGATVNECARVLRRAGAAQVDVVVLARALDPG